MRLYIPPNLADSTPPNLPVSSETAPPAGPSNLRQRVVYGLIGAAMLLSSVWFSPWTFGLFFAAVQAVMLWEFYRMMRAGGYAPATWIGVGAGIILFAIPFAGAYWLNLIFTTKYPEATDLLQMYEERQAETWYILAGVAIGTLIFVSFILLVREVVLWPKYQQPFMNMASVLGGLFYVSVPMTLMTAIAFNHYTYTYDPRRIFALLFLIWASDIGAYVAGKTFGKHKMAPQISPGKTWEGWAGGFVLTLVVGWAVGFMLPDMPLAHRLVAAGVVAVFAPLGDLAESMLKRSVGVKDSGSIMPGHGGLLDRFDAFLLVLPVLALLQLLF